MFNEFYLFYLLYSFDRNTSNKLELIKKIKDNLFNNSPILIKFIQIFLLTQYKWDNKFTKNEIIEINNVLNNFNYSKVDGFKVGCGSVAYVRFKDSKKKTVIKELIPDIMNRINKSFNKLKLLTNILWFMNMNIIDYKSLFYYKEFLIHQLDLGIESKNQLQMINIFKNIPFINIPNILNYTKQEIEMEYINGYTLFNFLEKYPHLEYNCGLLIFLSLKHMINNKYIHGDLHEGNFIFQYSENYNYFENIRIYLLDFGLVHNLSDNMQTILLKYFENPTTKTRCNLYYELTTKSKSFDEFYKFYIKNYVHIESNMGLKLHFWSSNGYEFNLEYVNLILSIIHLKVRFVNKYGKKFVDDIKTYYNKYFV